MDRKYQCPNCGSRYSDGEYIYEHEICGHLVCFDCEENHAINCGMILEQELMEREN